MKKRRLEKWITNSTWLVMAAAVSITACRPELNNEAGAGNSVAIDPSSTSLMIGNSKSFGIVEGTATLPVTWEVITGNGSIDSDTGLYTAPGSAGTDVIQAKDAHGFTGTAVITINGQIAVTSATDTEPTLKSGETHIFAAEGGVSPYTWSVTTGSGTFSDSTYTAPTMPLIETVTVTDSLGNTATAQLLSLGAMTIHLNASDMNGNGDSNSGWTNNDAVTNWTDSMGAASVSQSDAGKKPTFLTSDSDMNNMPSLSFDGGDCMTFDTDFHDETGNFNFFYAGKGSTNIEYVYYNAASGGGHHYIGSNSGHGLGGTSDGTTSISAAVASFINATHVAGYALTTTLGGYWGNGNSASQSKPAYVGFDSSDSTTGVLGSNSTTCASNNWTGSISEFIYYTTDLTADQAKATQCYLADRYGVTLVFAADCL